MGGEERPGRSEAVGAGTQVCRRRWQGRAGELGRRPEERLRIAERGARVFVLEGSLAADPRADQRGSWPESLEAPARRLVPGLLSPALGRPLPLQGPRPAWAPGRSPGTALSRLPWPRGAGADAGAGGVPGRPAAPHQLCPRCRRPRTPLPRPPLRPTLCLMLAAKSFPTSEWFSFSP